MSTTLARSERLALCDLFEEVGPDAPTLCEGWTTRDLAAHLIVRERRPDAALGLVLPLMAAHGENVRRRAARRDWSQLVDDLRSGPPLYSPTRLEAVDELVNTSEFFVHHEDVRRARTSWAPRDLPTEATDVLWRALERFASLNLRRVGVGVVLDDGEGRRRQVVRSDPLVEVHGPVAEIVMFVNGRKDHAAVELNGPDEAVTRLQNADLGI